jgi:hypothetical protein
MDAPAEQPAQSRRRWFRFCLRTLLILVTALSVLLGWIGWRLRQVRSEQATIAWVEEMGGKVSGPSWFSGKMRRVNLQFTQVSDVSPLAGLKSLEILSLYSTTVSDLTPLEELKNLALLHLDRTQVSDLSPLVRLKNLEMLSLAYTQVSDLSPLAELKNLKRLYLYSTTASDLSPLAELKSLEHLDLQNTQVSYDQVQELKQALPNCKIDHSSPVEE